MFHLTGANIANFPKNQPLKASLQQEVYGSFRNNPGRWV